MTQEYSLNLEKLHHIREENRDIYLLGTAHVSEQSVQDVREAVKSLQPDTICVELCPSRYQTLVHPDVWKKTDIYQVIKENKALFLLAQLALSTFYRKIGKNWA